MNLMFKTFMNLKWKRKSLESFRIVLDLYLSLLHLGIWFMGILVLLVLDYIYDIKAGSTLLQQALCVCHSKKDASQGLSVTSLHANVWAGSMVPIGLVECVNGCFSLYVALWLAGDCSRVELASVSAGIGSAPHNRKRDKQDGKYILINFSLTVLFTKRKQDKIS